MNTTKKLIALMLTILAFTACKNDDEPNVPTPDVRNNIYLAVKKSFDTGDLILTAKGDTIYQCAPRTVLQNLVANGRDWYAVAYKVMNNGIPEYCVIKNGNIIYTTTEEYIHDLCIDDGYVYTLQDTGSQTVYHEWVCKNFSRIYTLPNEEFTSTNMVVNHGDVALAPAWSTSACYWHNGELVAVQGMEGGLQAGHIDKDGNDVLIGISDVQNNKIGFWRNGTFNSLNMSFIYQVKLMNGKSYILGTRQTGQVGSVSSTGAVVVIDGQEHMLHTVGNSGAYKLVEFSGDNYILVLEYKVSTQAIPHIFKNMKELELDKSISEQYVIDFAIVDK